MNAQRKTNGSKHKSIIVNLFETAKDEELEAEVCPLAARATIRCLYKNIFKC